MIRRIDIENFKSLKNITLDLQRVNVLIGPNNSGKTNVLNAIELSLNHEKVKQLGQNEKSRLLYKFGHNNIPKIIIDFSLPDLGDTLQLEVTIFPLKIPQIKFNTNRPLIQSSFEKHYKSARVYSINTHYLTKSYPLLPGNELVHSDAANLVAFLDFLRDHHPDVFQNIQRDLTNCIPEITQIRFDNVNPTEEEIRKFGDKTFKKIGLFSQDTQQIFWSEELSEGILYLLALLCIIHQPHPPRLLLLEEPERGIHPRRIKEVIGFLKQLAYQRDIQIILTTHSPLVLDEFAETPESVFVFDKDAEGASTVNNLQKDVIEPYYQKCSEKGIVPHNYTDALGDNWTIGFLGGVPK
ncbi:AAA family ATPase [Runella zeae]|uniref:AAA family ATPase n=1 Tax=Runella zeae TaxID=94255 RepID=UPI00041F4ACF|nr:AAA family ATPase [Runella zeae]